MIFSWNATLCNVPVGIHNVRPVSMVQCYIWHYSVALQVSSRLHNELTCNATELKVR